MRKKQSAGLPGGAALGHDPVESPDWYNKGSIQPIDFMEDWDIPHHEATAFYYIIRAPYKGKYIEDLKKAIWYLRRKIALLEKRDGG